MNGPDAPAESPSTSPARDEDGHEMTRVMGELWRHSEMLVRQEIALVKAETELRLEHGKAALTRGAISAGLAHAAYLTTLATLVLVLAQWLAPWLASFIVAVVAVTGAVVFARLGKRRAEQALEKPKRALRASSNAPTGAHAT